MVQSSYPANKLPPSTSTASLAMASPIPELPPMITMDLPSMFTVRIRRLHAFVHQYFLSARFMPARHDFFLSFRKILLLHSRSFGLKRRESSNSWPAKPEELSRLMVGRTGVEIKFAGLVRQIRQYTPSPEIRGRFKRIGNRRIAAESQLQTAIRLQPGGLELPGLRSDQSQHRVGADERTDNVGNHHGIVSQVSPLRIGHCVAG